VLFGVRLAAINVRNRDAAPRGTVTVRFRHCSCRGKNALKAQESKRATRLLPLCANRKGGRQTGTGAGGRGSGISPNRTPKASGRVTRVGQLDAMLTGTSGLRRQLYPKFPIGIQTADGKGERNLEA
jgi:hypothetical protein